MLRDTSRTTTALTVRPVMFVPCLNAGSVAASRAKVTAATSQTVPHRLMPIWENPRKVSTRPKRVRSPRWLRFTNRPSKRNARKTTGTIRATTGWLNVTGGNIFLLPRQQPIPRLGQQLRRLRLYKVEILQVPGCCVETRQISQGFFIERHQHLVVRQLRSPRHVRGIVERERSD